MSLDRSAGGRAVLALMLIAAAALAGFLLLAFGRDRWSENAAATIGVGALGLSAATAALFRRWQIRTLVGAMFGYAAFYFVRKNLSFAMPAMQSDLGISKAELGIFLTLHGLLYGVSRFVNGMWADRANARYFMVAGLLLSVGANVFFGFSSTVLLLGVAWMINGWVQGMGFPPCCRLMTHWFRPERLASTMSVWNTSHSIGAALASVACGYFVLLGWRWCFFGPAILCTLAGLILFIVLRDTPRSVGLPEISTGEAAPEAGEDRSSADYQAFVRNQVFLNPFIWLISLANFFVYILRFAILDWGPTLLKEMKHFPVQKSGWMVGAFEVSGIIGMLLAGWITDRVFRGRGARAFENLLQILRPLSRVADARRVVLVLQDHSVDDIADHARDEHDEGVHHAHQQRLRHHVAVGDVRDFVTQHGFRLVAGHAQSFQQQAPEARWPERNGRRGDRPRGAGLVRWDRNAGGEGGRRPGPRPRPW